MTTNKKVRINNFIEANSGDGCYEVTRMPLKFRQLKVHHKK